MSDVTGMSLRSRAALVAAGLAAAALTGCSSSVRDEKVTLAGVRDAYVVTASGDRPLTDGETLGKGDRVRTGSSGTATLVVRERRVVLGGATEVTVPDGASIDLAKGALLVDRRRGPGLTLRAADTTIDEIGTGALRVERAFSVRVAALSASARVRTITGESLDLDALFQVGVAGRALPQVGLPLQLRHDAWERDVVAGLLADDERLNDLASGLTGRGAPILPATYRQGRIGAEQALADAIERAAGRPSSVSRARVLRSEGGSWGVIARLLDAAVADVGTALSEVLNGVPATSPSATARPGGPGVVAGGTPQPGTSPTPTPQPTRTPDPTRSPTPGPTSPTESPSTSPGVLDTVFSVLETPPVKIGL